jgi:hypothetical protein
MDRPVGSSRWLTIEPYPEIILQKPGPEQYSPEVLERKQRQIGETRPGFGSYTIAERRWKLCRVKG